MAVFFVLYFWTLRHPLQPAAVMPLTSLDRLIAFQPWALPLYLSLWVYVSLFPALLLSVRDLVLCSLVWVEIAVCGLLVFLFFPTTVPLPDIDWSLYPSFAFLKSVDDSGNACPSLHVAFAVFSAFGLDLVLREMRASLAFRLLNGLWCLGILYSTVAVRQHVALDVLAGSILGVLGAFAFVRLRRAFPATQPSSSAARTMRNLSEGRKGHEARQGSDH